jgi:AraC-like DNA-binding protein
MSYNIYKPSPFLSPFIRHFWSMESILPENNSHIQRIVPSGLCEMIFYLADRPKSLDSHISLNANTLIAGQLNDYYDLEVSGHLSLFSVLFKPLGLSAFFDLPVKEFYNQNVPLIYILKDDIKELEEKINEADRDEGRITIIEKFLSNRLRKPNKKYDLSRINAGIELINSTKGNIKVNDLASVACLSRKQFERIFSNLTGITPKRFLRIIRFQHALNTKSVEAKINLTGLTYECGYYDQSHMTNDFIKLSGMTPKKYFKDCTPYSDYFC